MEIINCLQGFKYSMLKILTLEPFFKLIELHGPFLIKHVPLIFKENRRLNSSKHTNIDNIGCKTRISLNKESKIQVMNYCNNYFACKN